MHRGGQIRIRKDKTDQELRRIKRAYYSALRSKPENLTEEKFIEKFNKVAPHLLDFEKVTPGRFTLSQARRLDKHLLWNVRKAARMTGLSEELAEKVTTFAMAVGDAAKDMD